MNEKTVIKIDRRNRTKNINENTTAIMLSFVRYDENTPTIQRVKDTIEERIASPSRSKKSTVSIEDRNR